jgi:hypothetical protein
MKKMLLLTALLALSLMTGCKKQLYQFIGTVPLEDVYLVDKPSGVFTADPFMITKEDVQDAINLPEHAAVDKVDLENSSVKIEPTAGNLAQQIILSGTITVGGNTIPLFSNLPIPFNQTVNLTTLHSTGVILLSGQVNAILANTSSQSIIISLSGSSVPAGSAIHVKLTYKLTCDAKFNSCIEIPSFISEGADCNL